MEELKKTIYAKGTNGYSSKYNGTVPSGATEGDYTYRPRSITSAGVGFSKFYFAWYTSANENGYAHASSYSLTSISYDQYPQLSNIYGERPYDRSRSISCAISYGAEAIARSGYTLVGWYPNGEAVKYGKQSSTNKIGTASGSTSVILIDPSVESASVVAVFGRLYKCYFNANGGTGKVKQGTNDSWKTGTSVYWNCYYGAGDYFVRKAPSSDESGRTSGGFKYTRAGYVFNGWNTRSNGSGTSYAVGDDIQGIKTTDNADDVTLYAQWLPVRKVEVTNENPEIGSIAIKDEDGNVLAEETGGVCSYDAVDGEDVYIHATYDSKLYSATLDVDDEGAEEVEFPFKVTPDGAGVSATCAFPARPLYSVNISCDSAQGAVDVSPEPDKDGKWLSQKLTFTVHSYSGFSVASFSAKDSDGDIVIPNITYSDGDSATTVSDITSDINVSATFSAGSATCVARVSQSSVGMGSVEPSNPVKVSPNSSVTFKATCSDQIFEFDGWYTKPSDGEETAESTSAEYTKTVSLNTTLFAKFKIASGTSETSTIKFGYASGSSSADGSVSAFGVTASSGLAEVSGRTGTEVVLSATVANGRKFVGWYDSTNLNTALSTSTKFRTFLKTRTILAKFASDTSSLLLWEGADARMTATWRSKTYVASIPFNPACCRVDATGYSGLNLKVDTFSSPDVGAKATGSATLSNIANQDARRLPMRRPERYLQVEVSNDAEVDAVLVGTSMGGLAV